MVNERGIQYHKYEATLKPLSSWEFILAGNGDLSIFQGDSGVKTFDYILKLNNSI